MNNNTYNYLRKVIVAGVFLLPIIPFIVLSSTYFPFISGKNLIFRLIVEVIFACWAILAIYDKNYRPKKSVLLASVTFFVATLGVSMILSPNSEKSFWSNFERMEGWVTTLHLFAYFLATSSVIIKEKLWEALFNTSIGASVILFFYSMLQLAGALDIHQGSNRVDATLGNSSYFATYMMIHIFISSFMLMKKWKSVSARWLYGIVILMQFTSLFYTQTRGAFLGLVAGVLVFCVAILFLDKKDKKFRWVAIGIIIASIIAVGSLYFARHSEFVTQNQSLQRFASVFNAKEEGQSRFMVWNMAWQGFKDRPIFGWGQESFNYVFNKYYDPGMYSQEQWFDRAHNVFFDWLIAGGILGILAYLSIFIFIVYLLLKRIDIDPKEKSVLLGLFAGYFVQNFFVFDNITSSILFFTIASYVYYLSTRNNENRILGKKVFSDNIANSLASGVSIVMIAVFYFVFCQGLYSSITLINALQSQKSGITKNIEYFEKVFSGGALGRQEAREQIVQMAMNLATRNIDISLKEKFFKLALTEINNENVEHPGNARYYLFASGLLSSYGMYDLALNETEKALISSPKKQTIIFQKVSDLINLKRYKEALEAAKNAYELEINFDDAREIYALTAVYNDNDKLARELLDPKDNRQKIEMDYKFANAYMLKKNYVKAEQIWLDIIKRNPGNAQYVFNLAGVYYEMGQIWKAISTLEEVKKNGDDTVKAQADFYIKQLKEGKKI